MQSIIERAYELALSGRCSTLIELEETFARSDTNKFTST
jgi:hypothetical protein